MQVSIANLVLDLLLVALVAYGLISGWKRGFVRVVFMKMRWLTALVVSFLVARPLGALLGKTLFGPSLEGKIKEILGNALGEKLSDATASELVSELPLALKGILNLFGFDAAKLAADAETAGGSLLDNFASTISSPVATVIGTVVVFIVAYIVLRLTLRFIVQLVSAIFSIPGLRIINKTLGVIFGLLFSLISAWILVTVLGLVFGILAGGDIAFFADFNINKTLIAKFFYQFKPLELIFSL